MALKHDSQGFLQGEPILVDKRSFERGVAVWKSIKNDTTIIRDILKKTPTVKPAKAGAAKAAAQMQAKVIAERIAAVIRAPQRRVQMQKRDASGRFVKAPQKTEAFRRLPMRNAAGQFVRAEPAKQEAPKATAKAPAERPIPAPMVAEPVLLVAPDAPVAPAPVSSLPPFDSTKPPQFGPPTVTLLPKTKPFQRMRVNGRFASHAADGKVQTTNKESSKAKGRGIIGEFFAGFLDGAREAIAEHRGTEYVTREGVRHFTNENGTRVHDYSGATDEAKQRFREDRKQAKTNGAKQPNEDEVHVVGLGEGIDKLENTISHAAEPVVEAVEATAEAEPTVKAVHELGSGFKQLYKIGTAPFRAVYRLFRRDPQAREQKKQTRWLAKIANFLQPRLTRRPENAGGRGIGLFGMLGGFGAMLAGGITKLFAGIGSVLVSLIAKSIGPLGRTVSFLAGQLRPFAGLIAKASLPLAAMLSSVKSFNTSTEEYARRLGVELNGSLAQELGVRFVGVLGDLGNTLTFGLAGKFGELIAPHASEVFSFIENRWNDVATKWEKASAWASEKWGAVVGKFEAVADWIGEKFGKAKEAVKQAAGAAKEQVLEVGDFVAGAGGRALDALTGKTDERKRALELAATQAGITDPREIATFMARMDHESGGFSRMEENLKYRSADRLMDVSKRARLAGREKVEAAIAGGEQGIATLLYEGRSDLGNTQSGDGYKFRGRGFTQLTGRANYERAGKALGIDLVNNPDLAADPGIAARIATWFWQDKKLGAAGRAGNVEAVTRGINGGTNGLADTKQKFDAYFAHYSRNQATTAVWPAMPRAQGASAAAPAVPSGAMPSAKTAAASVPAAAPAPPAASPTISVRGNRNTVITQRQPVGQNVQDRGIAQVATGGIGSGN